VLENESENELNQSYWVHNRHSIIDEIATELDKSLNTLGRESDNEKCMSIGLERRTAGFRTASNFGVCFNYFTLS
jgi:hypothetical protein